MIFGRHDGRENGNEGRGMMKILSAREFAALGVLAFALAGAPTPASAGFAPQDGVKKVATEAADKAEDVKDQTEKGYRTAEKHAKKGAHEVADKAEDVKDESVKGAKKTGNWFKRMWGKVF
jgi:hypothetical protein